MGQKIYIYEVRGIQEYIFRTDKVKEIIGASRKVEDILIQIWVRAIETKRALMCKQAYEYYRGQLPMNIEVVEDDRPVEILNENSPIEAEVVYYGGGNLLVLYKDEKIAEQVSRRMSIDIIKETYSLRIVYAGTMVTGEYSKDITKLRENLIQKKKCMPASELVRGFPITVNDPVTGMPFSMVYSNHMVTYESYKKLEHQDSDRININTFGSEEGENLIATIHIDGNRIGDFVNTQMQKVKESRLSYGEAIKKSRYISRIIQKTFVKDALSSVENNVEKYCDMAGLKNRNKKNAFRKIITAGDDITFICNARIALNCVQGFMRALDENIKLDDGTTYKFTACGGMYISHTHFPFSRAYQYAEELCENAKRISRKNKGNYLDFMMENGGKLNSVDIIRGKEMYDVDEKYISARPYYITDPKEADESLHGIEELLNVLESLGKIPRTKLKELRETFLQGERFLNIEIMRINSRLNEEEKINVDTHNCGILFDAIDIMDMGWGKNHVKTDEIKN